MKYSVTLWRNFFIFGLDRLNTITKPLNIIILYAKYYIYTTRCNERHLFLEVYKKKLYQLFKILKENTRSLSLPAGRTIYNKDKNSMHWLSFLSLLHI